MPILRNLDSLGFAGRVRNVLRFSLFALTLACPVGIAALAQEGHEGHNHGPAVAEAGPTLLPRASVVGDLFEVVAEIANGNLIIFVDDPMTNAPVQDATVELVGESGSVFATPVGPGLFVSKAFAPKPATYNLMLSIESAAGSDLLALKLVVPQAEPPAGAGSPLLWVVIGQSTAALAALAGVLLLFGFVQARRGRWSPVVALPGGFTLLGSGGRQLVASHCVQRVGPQMLIGSVLGKSGLENALVSALAESGASRRHLATYVGMMMQMLFDAGSRMSIGRWAQDTKLPVDPPQAHEVRDALAWLDESGGANRRAVESAFIRKLPPVSPGTAFFYLLQAGARDDGATWIIYGAGADGTPIGIESIGQHAPDLPAIILNVRSLAERRGLSSACLVLQSFNDPEADAALVVAAGLRFIAGARLEAQSLPVHAQAYVLLHAEAAEVRIEYTEFLTGGPRMIACHAASGANRPHSEPSADWRRFGAEYGALHTNLEGPTEEIISRFSSFMDVQRASHGAGVQADPATGQVPESDLLAFFMASVVRHQVRVSSGHEIDWPTLIHELNQIVEVRLKGNGGGSTIVTEADGEAGTILSALTDETADAPRRGRPGTMPTTPALAASGAT